MKLLRYIAITLTLTMLLCACDTQKIQAAALTTLLYNETLLTDIESNDGNTVTVTGYISMMSPLDNTVAYVMSTPFNTNPDKYSSNTNLVDMVACYPPVGQYIEYTEQCITVTGIINYKTIEKDTSGYTYPFYLSDCTYTIFSGTDAVSEYNYGITSGVLSEIDDWITAIYLGMATPTSATVVDIKAHKDAFAAKLGDRVCSSISSLAQNVERLTEVYNAWVESDADEVTEDLSAAYITVGTSMNEWLDSLALKGNEI